MYFLNGDRTFIKPEKACGTLNDQLENCLNQLSESNSGTKIFKLNFFVDTDSESEYTNLLKAARKKVKKRFHEDIVLSFIAQPPLTCKVIIEAFYFDPKVWECQLVSEGLNGAALFQNGNTEILLGTVHANDNSNCKLNAEKAFDDLIELLDTAQFPLNSIVRQWNYLEDILGFDGEEQRYQEFNNVRSLIYGNDFENVGYPAATGIGMNRGGVILEFVAVKSDLSVSKSVDNPEQIAAHVYSDTVLVGEQCVIKTTPKFERARYFQMFEKKMIFISGTASIVGEHTVGVGDAEEQTKVTIQNIERLYSHEVLQNLEENDLQAKYGHARVYVKNRNDFPVIKKTFKTHFGDLPVVYIIADICRNDLLVEIEGKVILE
jgi:enamine deaminase RidA (YjgF/YER057c/UK114 family)